MQKLLKFAYFKNKSLELPISNQPGFILNLENQGKPGKVMESCIIFIQVREKSGKINYLIRISFVYIIGMIAHKIVTLSVVKKYELYALLCRITSIMCFTYL